MNPQNMKVDDAAFDLFFTLTMRKRWKDVVSFYTTNPWARTAKLTKYEDTALHIAISNYQPAQRTGISVHDVKKMLDSVLAMGPAEAYVVLSMQNDRGNTPLYVAAKFGWVAVCEHIASQHPGLVTIRNANGQTPLYGAARHGKTEAFLCLYKIYNAKKGNNGESDESLCRRKDGNTVLHSAITGGYFGLAFQIIKRIPKLVNSVNVQGESPLHVLAKKPSVFKSSSHMGLYDSVIYHCVFVDELKKQEYNSGGANQYTSSDTNNKRGYPDNYRTCVNIFRFLWDPIYKSFQASEMHTGDIEHRGVKERRMERSKLRSYFPPNYATDVLLFKFGAKVILSVLGVGFWRIQKILEKKQRYTQALQIMNEMIESESRYKYDSNGQKPVAKLEHHLSGRFTPPDSPPLVENVASQSHPTAEINSGTTCSNDIQNDAEKEKDQNKSAKIASSSAVTIKETPLLVAAKMGIPEMVKKIFETCPVAIQDIDSKGKNVLLLAAENRQSNVFDYLLKIKLTEDMFHHVDDEGNSILHLAARMGKYQPWRIPGAALQMQWEIKWYKYVKHSVPRYYLAHQNLKGDTPRQVFTETHKKLLKEGTNWLIKTSESCSFVAALIAAVAFATSATVPGGLDDHTGRPILTDRLAFDVFSISSLVALCLSVTALVFFLAIITSRCEERDFKGSLPRRLLNGLTCLFSSIAAMLVSFCSGHTFILRSDLRLAVIPIYAFACVPVTLFAFAQLPLYFDLLRAAYSKVPLRSYKVFYQ